MQKIMDIYGNSEKDRWYGRILVDEDSTFEGIASSDDREETYLLYGLISDIGLELTKMSMRDKKTFLVVKKDDKRSLVTTLSNGKINITLMPQELTRESSVFETETLKQRIRGKMVFLNGEDKVYTKSSKTI